MINTLFIHSQTPPIKNPSLQTTHSPSFTQPIVITTQPTAINTQHSNLTQVLPPPHTTQPTVITTQPTVITTQPTNTSLILNI